MFGISDEETDEMCVVETALDTNMAACCIKLEDYQKALDYAKMVTVYFRFLASSLSKKYFYFFHL